MLRLKNKRMRGEEALAMACFAILAGSMSRAEEGLVVFLNSIYDSTPQNGPASRRMKIRLVFLIKLPAGVNAPAGNPTSPSH